MSSFENWNVPEVDARCINKKTLEDDLHAALNPNICEPVAVEENTIDESLESPQGPEVVFIDPNTIIDREVSLSERLQGSARKAAEVMALLTALTSLSGFSKDAQAVGYAESLGRPERTEQMSQQETKKTEKNELTKASKQIGEKATGYTESSERSEPVNRKDEQRPEKVKLTNASKWAGEKVKSAQKDLQHIKTAQDAEWLVKLHMDEFADDFYSAPRTPSGRIAYNTELFYTIDDAQYVIECAKTLKGIMEDLQGRYGVGNYEERQARLDKVISNLEQQTSYSSLKEREIQRDMAKQFKFHKYR